MIITMHWHTLVRLIIVIFPFTFVAMMMMVRREMAASLMIQPVGRQAVMLLSF